LRTVTFIATRITFVRHFVSLPFVHRRLYVACRFNVRLIMRGWLPPTDARCCSHVALPVTVVVAGSSFVPFRLIIRLFVTFIIPVLLLFVLHTGLFTFLPLLPPPGLTRTYTFAPPTQFSPFTCHSFAATRVVRWRRAFIILRCDILMVGRADFARTIVRVRYPPLRARIARHAATLHIVCRGLRTTTAQ